MSLGGLAIAIGLVIDDAIVVVENIHRHRAAGETVPSRPRRARRSCSRRSIGSTLTTVVVFVPLGLLQGVVGQFFAALSLTLAAAVLLSLVYALLFIPGAAARFLRDAPTSRTARPGLAAGGYRALLRRGCGGRALVVGRHAGVRGAGRAALHAARDRIPAGDGRGRVRRRLLDAGRHVAARDRPDAQPRRGRPQRHAGGGRASPGAPARSWACSRRPEHRRHRGEAEAAVERSRGPRRR